ncbi:MAG: class I SAM-dependent methyltransferase [Burkholderiaceae bacterium]|nr:class I SAM-dependent methyltransferase [Burkholderiaceae bacterium]
MTSTATTPPTPPGFADARATWDARFAKPGLLFGAEPNAFLVREAARFAPASSVLSVADGEGRNSLWLAEQGHAVTAFDVSPIAVDKARRWATERGASQGNAGPPQVSLTPTGGGSASRPRGLSVAFHVAGVDNWNWAPDQFDAVVAIFVQFADPALRRQMFDGMWRTLQPGGLLCVQGYTPKQLDYRTGGPGRLDHLYTPELLRELLPAAEWLLLREHEATLQEGAGHAGRSALIDAVARKPR